jgi:hypothetical protein
MVCIRVLFTACLFSGCIESATSQDRAWAEDRAATDVSAREDIWNVDQEALQRLLRMRAPRGDTRAALNEGDEVPDDYPVQDVPQDVLERLAPPRNPYSALQLQFYSAGSQIALLLPLSRRAVKIFNVRAPLETSVPADASVRAETTPPAPKALASVHLETQTPPSPSVRSAMTAPAPQAQRAGPLAPEPVREAAIARPAPPTRSQPQSPGADEVDTVIRRADESRQRGDIMVMRLFLERAASLGSQEAKYRLGETYDERMLKSWGARGVRPDPARAEALYRESGMDRARAEPASAAQKRP